MGSFSFWTQMNPMNPAESAWTQFLWVSHRGKWKLGAELEEIKGMTLWDKIQLSPFLGEVPLNFTRNPNESQVNPALKYFCEWPLTHALQGI
jgi:hypothetical protein